MDNSSYRSQYVLNITTRADISSESGNTTRNFWNRLENAEREIGKPVECGYTSEEYARLLSKMKTINIGAFRVMKSRLYKYIEWLVDQNAVSLESLAALRAVGFSDIDCGNLLDMHYFRDFSSLQSRINDTLVASERADDAVFAMQISAIYLMWFGVTLENALTIKKSDVLDDSISVCGRTVRPNSAAMDYIVDYRDAIGYQSYGKGIIFLKYIPSEYLFRSARADRIDRVKAVIAITRFGKSGGEEKNPYLPEKIYWSGIFHRTYISELEHGEIDPNDKTRMELLFQEEYKDIATARMRLEEYRKYQNHFFPSQNR